MTYLPGQRLSYLSIIPKQLIFVNPQMPSLLCLDSQKGFPLEGEAVAFRRLKRVPFLHYLLNFFAIFDTFWPTFLAISLYANPPFRRIAKLTPSY